jgi:hypothetical protein
MKQNPILDTRDLEKRRAELQDLADALEDAKNRIADMPNFAGGGCREEAREQLADAQEAFGDDEAQELAELDDLESEVPEWYDGNTLIPADQFTDYCKELLDDLGELPRDLPDCIAIDWDKTADNLKADYSECEYQGETYLYRDC